MTFHDGWIELSVRNRTKCWCGWPFSSVKLPPTYTLLPTASISSTVPFVDAFHEASAWPVAGSSLMRFGEVTPPIVLNRPPT